MQNLAIIAALSLCASCVAADSPPLTVHEWGTFTSLQDERGATIGGINTDDEPLPKFVHRIADLLLLSPTEVPGIFFQGAPRCHPGVTMRLETPVIYFHLPAGKSLSGLSVTAQFRGGWLSEFYPNAEAIAPGVDRASRRFGTLASDTLGSLSWTNLQIGGDWSGPATDAHVWTAPRAVRAASVRTPAGEAEKFLFYRGVGHIDAPIRISRNSTGDQLTLHDQCPVEITRGVPLPIPHLWLVDIAGDRKLAFRRIPPITLNGTTNSLTRISARFPPSEFSPANRSKLVSELHAALVEDGLFSDEAHALLNTWELSYFQSPGTRVFFLVPQAWTDFYLPLQLSQPAQLTRTMVGRIELKTPLQQRTLEELARFTPSVVTNELGLLHASFYSEIATKTDLWKKVSTGAEPLSKYLPVPATYQTYLTLGRFRNALILEEARQRPTPGLKAFISSYRLEGYNQ